MAAAEDSVHSIYAKRCLSGQTQAWEGCWVCKSSCLAVMQDAKPCRATHAWDAHLKNMKSLWLWKVTTRRPLNAGSCGGTGKSQCRGNPVSRRGWAWACQHMSMHMHAQCGRVQARARVQPYAGPADRSMGCMHVLHSFAGHEREETCFFQL